MARDKITVDLELQAKQAYREVERLNRKIAEMGKGMSKSFGAGMGGGDKVRALGTGLSKATVKADEFNKSLEASNARVIAFGASAGLIMQVDRALKAMVASAIKVEKAMMDVNIVMDLSTQQLEKFGRGMFKVAKETGQAFETVAEATTEFARQGLGMEKTLVRTKDALILTRLTGMNAADSVKSLTAAVNSFNKEGVTSSQVINRMAKVDQKFAVSSDDLAKAVSRVGASAISAGVNLNELMAITTAVQQKTARGGAVIGNAFKTIFTRIQRSDVKNQLRNYGVAVTDNNGKMLSGIQILQNLANEYENLSKTQQSSVAEQVAGVFQVNILKAALSDLSAETSHYKGALRAASSATDEAYEKNRKLNETLDTLVNKTLVNLTQAGASLGGATLAPAIQKLLNGVNSAIESFGEGGRFEKFGKGIGSDLLKGIGNAIAGPGLVIMGAVITKLALSLGKYTAKAFADLTGINNATKQRIALEEAVIAHISAEPALLAKVNSSSLGILATERSILTTIKAQALERAKMTTAAAPIAGALYGRGVRVGPSGVSMRGKPGGASGFVPNFANAGSERMAAAAGGYRAGAIRTMQQPGTGTMMYNSAETVKRFPGMSQSAIMPPRGSSAGDNYRSGFEAAHGFDPYAANGFVPNYAGKRGRKKGVKGGIKSFDVKNRTHPFGVILGSGSTTPVEKTYTQPLFGTGGIKAIANDPSDKYVQRMKAAWLAEQIPNPKFQMRGVPTRALFPLQSQKLDEFGDSPAFDDEFNRFLDEGLGDFGARIAKEIFPRSQEKKITGISKFLGSDVRGHVFEASLRGALKQKPSLVEGAGKHASFDFNPNKEPDKELLRLFRVAGEITELERVEAKIKESSATNILSKYANEFGAVDFGGALHNIKYTERGKAAFSPVPWENAQAAKKTKGRGKKGALGFIPNYSPLTNAVGRELSAGVPASAIRIGSSSTLKSSGNRGGLGVYNTRDEPGGLGQGISRSRSQGMNPKTHGYSRGFVPNFERFAPGTHGFGGNVYQMNQTDELIKASRNQTQASKTLSTKLGLNTKSVDGLKITTTKYGKITAQANKLTPGKAVGWGFAATMMAPAVVGQLPLGERTKASAVEGISGAGFAGGTAAIGMSALGGGLSMAGATTLAAGVATAALPVTIAAALAWGGWKAYQAWNKEAEPAVEIMKEQTEAIKSLSQVAMEAATGVKALNKELSNAAFLSLKEAEIKRVTSTDGVDMSGTKEDKALRGVIDQKQLYEALAAYANRAKQKELVQGMTRKGAFGVDNFAPGFMERERKSRAKAYQKVGYSEETATLKKELGAMTLIRQKSMFGTKKPKEFQLEKEVARREAYDLLERAKYESFATLPGTPGKGMAYRVVDSLGEGGGGQFGLSAYYRRLAAKGEGIGLGAIPPAGAAEKLSAISGLPASDFKGIVDEMREEMSPEQFKNFNSALLSLMTDVERYNKSVIELIDLEEKRKKEAEGAISANLEFIKSIRNLDSRLLSLSQAADLNFKLAQKESKQKLALLKLTQQETKVGKAMSSTKRQLIQEDYDQAITTAGETKKEAGVVATAQRTRDLVKAGATAGMEATQNLLKLFADEKLAPKGAEKQEKAIIAAQTATEALMNKFAETLDPQAFADLLVTETAKQSKLLAQQSTGFKDMSEEERQAAMKQLVALNAVLAKAREAEGKRRETVELAKETEKDAGELAKKGLDVALKRYENDVKINESQRETLRAAAMLKSMLDSMEAEKRFGAGRISGAERRGTESKMWAKLASTDMTDDEIIKEFGPKAGSQVLGMDRSPEAIFQKRVEFEKKLYEEAITGLDEFGNSARSRIDDFNDFKAAMRTASADVVSFSQALQASFVRDQAEADYKAGRTTSDSIRGARAADRLTRRRTGRAQEGDMMEAFTDQFLYNGQDAMDEFEDGVISVAGTMKSSFADAFQSITSGADSARGAFANMAQSILDSVSQMSAQMFTNMMFSKMGFSQGGLVPGYAGGGVVRGGSGYKDDVPTMMQGGEFVIKKSSAQKIGYGTLNSINGYAEGGPIKPAGGGPSMWKMGAISAGASALSGIIQQANAPGSPDPLPSRDYGFGKSKYGFLGGADPDAGQTDSISGGRGRAGVSLGKGFVYYRRDPETGRLISERARPTEGRFEVSQRLSLLGRLGEDDPQTSRMFGKEQTMANYQHYLETETQSRKDQIEAVKKQKKQRLIGAYMNAAMLIGGAKMMQGASSAGPDVIGPEGKTYSAFRGDGGTAYRLSDTEFFKQGMPGGGHLPAGTIGSMNSTFNPFSMAPRLDIGGDPRGGANGGMARVMGGEYIMSPETVRTYGPGFMQELNRGNVPSYAGGGPVGGASLGNQGASNGETPNSGNTTNNVKINVNVDKSGKADASVSAGPQGGSGDPEESDREEVENNKALGKLLQGVVLEELVKQQRPGGLLRTQRA